MLLPDSFEGRGVKGQCGAPLDDWDNGGYADFFFMCGECGFSSLESWSCSEERVTGFSDKKYVALFQGSEVPVG